jgi:PAS domain S-box-containing protein
LKKQLKPRLGYLANKLPLEKFIPFAFFVFLLLFIALSIVTYKSIALYSESYGWVKHTNEVLNVIDNINLLTTQMQLYRRGYIVKTDDKYLSDYFNSKNTIHEKFTELKELTGNNHSQLEKIIKLDSLVLGSIVYLDSSISHFETFKTIDPEVQRELSTKSQNYLDNFFISSKGFKDSEITLLTKRQEQANINLINTQLFIIVTSIFVFVVLGLSLYISSRLIRNKNIAEKLLKKSYDELEEKVEERTAELKGSNEKLTDEINNRIKVEQSLRESEARFRTMADSSPVLIWMSGTDKLCTYFNKGWLEFTGRIFEQEIGNGWTEGIHPDDLKICMEVYTKAFDKREEFEMEYRLKTAYGDYKWIFDRGIPLYQGGEFTGYIGSCIDIHSRKKAERYLRIQYSVSKSLAESKSVKEALQKALECICSELNWGMGIVWTLNGVKLSLEAIWSENINLLKTYKDLFEKYSFEKGIGLPGKVWKHNKSYWIQNIADETNFARKEGILKFGWKSALGFPICENNRVIAVVECFNEDELSPKEDLLEILEITGRQIGNFLERKKIEEKLRESHYELENRVKERTMDLANTLNRLLKEIEEKEKVQNKLKLFGHVIKGVKEGIFITELNNNTVFINSAFESIYGYNEEELLYKKIPVLFSDLIDDASRERILKDSLKGGWKGELKNRKKDGSEFDIYLSTTVIRNDEGKVQALVGICQDISESKQQKALLEKRYSLLSLLNDVIVIVSRSFNLEAAISYALNKICEYTKWEAGHCFFADDERLVTSRIWNGNLSPQFLKFKELTEKSTFQKGEGMPGKAFLEKHSFWSYLDELAGNPRYKRAKQTFDCGLRTGMWIPIIKNNNVVGILEFFNRQKVAPDEELLDCITNICIEIGNLYERNEFIDIIKEREKHFKAVADTANEAIITINSRGEIIYTNNSTLDIFGYGKEELNGEVLTLLMPEHYKARHLKAFERVIKTGNSLLIGETIELEGKRKNGKEFPIELSLSKWEMNGQTYFTGMIRDISLRKQIELELLESRNSLLEAQSIAKMGNWEWDVKTDTVKWSDEMYNIYELSRNEFGATYKDFLTMIHPEDVEYVEGKIENSYKSKEDFEFYERIITPGGKTKILRSIGGVKTDNNGNVKKFVGTCLDVTQVREAEEKIRENEERLRLIMESIKDYSIITVDINGVIKSWNSGAKQITGYEKDEVIGRNMSIFYPRKEIEEKQPQHNLEMAKENGRFEREGWRIRKDGTRFWADITFSPLYDGKGNLSGFVKITRDITERKKAEEAIQESEHRLKEAQKIAKLGSWESNLETRDVEWSDEMYRIFEIEKDFNIKDFEYLKHLILVDDLKATEKIINDLQTNPREMEFGFRIITKEGRLKYLTNDIRVEYGSNSKPKRIYGSTQDITDIKLAEEELKRANAKLVEAQKELVHKEKLAALGRFSSGIAHEIRNPLANISALAQLLSKAKIDDEKMKKHLKYILVNSDIANNIIKQLLNFASSEDLFLKEENIGEILDNIINSVEQRCENSKIRISKEIETNALKIYLDKPKLENALLNFISNSIDAMPGGGKLTVKAKSGIMKNEVVIDIIDTGVGIPSENMDKIFEPFFTTKVSGTGLGMSLSYQTVKLHRGILNISSEPGKGTRLQIKLPVNGQ